MYEVEKGVMQQSYPLRCGYYILLWSDRGWYILLWSDRGWYLYYGLTVVPSYALCRILYVWSDLGTYQSSRTSQQYVCMV